MYLTRLKPTLFLLALGTIFIGCQSDSEDPQVDCSVSSLTLTIVNVTDANCDQSNGQIIVAASGGSGDYDYSLNTGATNTTGEFMDVSAGAYTVRVDDGDCSRQLTATVNNEGGVVITNVSSEDSGCGTTNGVIAVSAEEGVPPYAFALNSGAFQDESTFTGLPQGTYTLRVTDSQDCEITQEVQVLSGISWASTVSSIISTKCAIPSCHGGTQAPDYREFSNVQAFASQIKTRTGNGTMPPTGALPADEVQAIACWVDDGAPNN